VFDAQKQETEDPIMRVVILAAAATLVVTGAATARESVHHHHHAMHHHYHSATAPVAEGAASADSLSAHDAYMKNLHDSGHNPHSDFDANGIMKSN
jgi:ABC-type molybdate transport system substrate-binding protein